MKNGRRYLVLLTMLSFGLTAEAAVERVSTNSAYVFDYQKKPLLKFQPVIGGTSFDYIGSDLVGDFEGRQGFTVGATAEIGRGKFKIETGALYTQIRARGQFSYQYNQNSMFFVNSFGQNQTINNFGNFGQFARTFPNGVFGQTSSFNTPFVQTLVTPGSTITETVDINAGYLAVPILAKFEALSYNSFGIHLRGGIMPMYLVNDQSRARFFSSNGSANAGSVELTNIAGIGDQLQTTDFLNDFDVQMMAGLGTRIKVSRGTNINLDVTFNRGLLSVDATGNSDVFAQGFMLMGGVIFEL